uniref:Putative secreted protein n=1 Tax=Panstrongylus lignarius TaxID=156445 RepID=A0A224XW03_9HEMI
MPTLICILLLLIKAIIAFERSWDTSLASNVLPICACPTRSNAPVTSKKTTTQSPFSSFAFFKTASINRLFTWQPGSPLTNPLCDG